MIKGKKRPRTGRNNVRRLESQGFNFPGLFLASLVVLVIAALSYGRIYGKVNSLSRQIKLGEAELQNKIRIRRDEEFKWSSMTSVVRLEQKLREVNLDMGWPEPARVVVVRDLEMVLGRKRSPDGEIQLAEAKGRPTP